MLKVCLTTNLAWNIANFRLNHARALLEMGVEVHAVAPPDETVAKIERAGLVFHPWHVDRRSLNPLKDVAAVNELRRIYVRIAPSLVHHYTVKALLYGTLAARLARVPAVVNSVTGLPYIVISEKPGLAKRAASHAAMRWYGWSLGGRRTGVVAQNRDDLQLLERYAPAIGQRAMLTAGSGVDLDHFPQVALPENAPLRLLFVGRLLREKGVFELVEAMRLLRAAGRDVRLTLCGKTDPANRSSASDAECDRWQREGLAEIAGYQEDVRPLLAASDVVILPSWREGTPRSLLEALATGRPIIATDVPGCREVVDDGENGLLVALRSPQGIADAVSQLADAPETRARMAVASRAKAETVFDERQVIRQTLELYQRLVPGETAEADSVSRSCV